MTETVFEADVSYKLRESNKSLYTSLFDLTLLLTVPPLLIGIGFIISGIGSGNLADMFSDSGSIAIVLIVLMFFIVTPALVLRLAIKYWTSELRCRYIFREDKMIIVNRDGSEDQLDYGSITAVTERDQEYMIYISKYKGYILPKVSLTEITHEEFAEFVIRKTNMRIQRQE